MGPGNFQLLDFGSGADQVRQALAGNYNDCESLGDTVTTQPGNQIGPVGQGLNTRFDQYGGGGLSADDYPSDVYVGEPADIAVLEADGVTITYSDTSGSGGEAWGYSDYETAAAACPGSADCRSDGDSNRRVIQVPIVDCGSSDGGGVNTLTVEAFGCFFLVQQAPTTNGSKQPVFGEYIEECYVPNGSFGNGGGTGEGPFRVVLYDDPLSESS